MHRSAGEEVSSTDPLNKPQTADQEGEKISPHWAKAAEGGGQQHWDRAWDLYGEAWFVLNITKYVERYRHKNGMQDLLKARNYLNKLIELEQRRAHEGVTDHVPQQPAEDPMTKSMSVEDVMRRD
jgi:hypothetical protein